MYFKHRRTRRSAWCDSAEFCDGPNFCFSTRGVLSGGRHRRRPDRFPHRSISQTLDPGWQLVYAGQPGYEDGLMESMFGDGTGQAIDGRAYQPPASIYSEADPTARSRAHRRAPRFAQPPQPCRLWPFTRSARKPSPGTSTRLLSVMPPPQAGTAGQARPYYYQPAPTQFQAAPPAPPSGWRVVAPAPHKRKSTRDTWPRCRQGNCVARKRRRPDLGWRPRPPAQTDPQFTGSVAAQVRTIQPMPANYRVAPAQPAQASAQSIASAAQQVRGLFAANYQGAAAAPAGAYLQPGQYPQQPVRQQLAFGYKRGRRSRAMCINRAPIRRRVTHPRPMGTWRSSSIRAISAR